MLLTVILFGVCPFERKSNKICYNFLSSVVMFTKYISSNFVGILLEESVSNVDFQAGACIRNSPREPCHLYPEMSDQCTYIIKCLCKT